ncbi:acyl-CoA-like ligand-binding transcription factor [Saccharopolyspora sp. NPDC002376]
MASVTATTAPPRLTVSEANLEAALASGLAQRLGRDREDLYIQLLASTAITAMRTSIQSWHQAGPDVDPHEFLDQAFDLLGRGMPPD